MIENTTPKIQGARIKALRKKLKLSRRAFAQRQQLSTSTLQALEEGLYKNGLTLKNSEPLLHAFRNEGLVVDYGWLVEGVGNAPKSIYAVNLSSVRSSKKINADDILAMVDHNKLRMEQNKKAITAIKNSELTKLEMAVACGANAHLLKAHELYIVTGPKQDTLLHLAARYSSREIINYLITKLGIHPNIRNQDMDTPAHAACASNNAAGLRVLIEFDTNLEAGSHEGNTPLIWAAYLGHIDCMAILLNHYVKINNTDMYGNTAAHWAAYHDKVESLEFLYHHGAEMFLFNYDKKTPIDWACQNGHKQSVKFLLASIKNQVKY